MHRPDGDQGAGLWEGFTWEWNEAESEAMLVTGGKTVLVGDLPWTYPSGPQCDQCHQAAAYSTLGPETAQLNYDIVYAETGNTANQLTTLDAIGYFQSPLSTSVDELPRLPDPFDETAEIGARARAYLHSNCAQCHRPGTANPSSMDWRYQTLLENVGACDVENGLGDLGLGAGARLIAPGDSAQSVIVARMLNRDGEQMPPLATQIVDADGVAVVSAWIDSLQSCVQ
jgi:mono/diheme cytochrome c family protein